MVSRLAFKLCSAVSKGTCIPSKVRVMMLKAAGLDIKEKVTILSGCYFNTSRVSVGGHLL